MHGGPSQQKQLCQLTFAAVRGSGSIIVEVLGRLAVFVDRVLQQDLLLTVSLVSPQVIAARIHIMQYLDGIVQDGILHQPLVNSVLRSVMTRSSCSFTSQRCESAAASIHCGIMMISCCGSTARDTPSSSSRRQLVCDAPPPGSKYAATAVW